MGTNSQADLGDLILVLHQFEKEMGVPLVRCEPDPDGKQQFIWTE